MAPGKVSGSCLCKQVQYTITGEEVASSICHCKNCQQTSGSAFGANVIYPKSSFKIDQGEDTIKQYADSDTASGSTILRHFCSNCGSPLFILNPTRHDNIVVASGSMKDANLARPTLEFWTKHKREWVEGLDGAKTWEAGRT
jgi:hypothetical protein